MTTTSLSFQTDTGKHLAEVAIDCGVQFSVIAPGVRVIERIGSEENIHDHNEDDLSDNPRDCGQVGFWVMTTDPGNGEPMQWGIDGDTQYPYRTYDEAESQARHLMGTETHKDDVFSIINVFPNGQIRVDVVEPA